MTLYDEWSLEKQNSLRDLGCDIEIIWTRTNDEKISSGTEVCDCIINNKPRDHLVPQYVYKYALKHHIDFRLQAMAAKEEDHSC